MRRTLTIIITIFLYNLTQGYAQNWQQGQKLTATDRVMSAKFSKSLDLSGRIIGVGAHRVGTDVEGKNPLSRAGAVYFYYKDDLGNWGDAQKVVSSDRREQDNFGTSLAVSGGAAIIGAYKRDELDERGQSLYQCGAAYIFERDETGEWIEKQKLIAPDKDSLNYFGVSVDIFQDYAVVGASYRAYSEKNGNRLPQVGAVYIYQRDTSGKWNIVQEITPPNPEPFALFGWSVAISDSYVVVGAYKEDNGASTQDKLVNAGAVYIFRKTNEATWEYDSRLIASDRSSGSWFGWDVAVSGQYMLAGAPQDPYGMSPQEQKNKSGSAYIFKKSSNGNWEEIKKLKAPDWAEEASFGYAVDLSGDRVLIGARWEDFDANNTEKLNNAGAAYLYQIDNQKKWQFTEKITPEKRHVNDWFGFSVALDEDEALIGAFSDDYDAMGDHFVNDAGAAYVFSSTVSTSLTKKTKPIDSMSLFSPNPTSNTVYISGIPGHNYRIWIYDLTGNLLLSHEYEWNASIDFGMLSSGIYLAYWTDDMGNKKVQKIILSK